MSVTDIVVIARRSGLLSGEVTAFFRRENVGQGEVPAYDSANNTDPSIISVQVRVKIDVTGIEYKAIEAAQNVAKAVATIIQEAAKLPANTVIQLPNGKTTNAGELLNVAKATKFIITDASDYQNNGVGGADRPTLTDKLYFANFVEGAGPSSYTDSQWQEQGMTGIMLHELGHLSNAGYNNWLDSVKQYNFERSKHKLPDIGFYASDYAPDNERFQHQYAKSAAQVLNIPFNVYDSITYFNDTYLSPAGVYLKHVDENGW